MARCGEGIIIIILTCISDYIAVGHSGKVIAYFVTHMDLRHVVSVS